jgi:hypothetical protein
VSSPPWTAARLKSQRASHGTSLHRSELTLVAWLASIQRFDYRYFGVGGGVRPKSPRPGPITPTEAVLLRESSMANSAELSFGQPGQTRGGVQSPRHSLKHINGFGLNVGGQSRMSKRANRGAGFGRAWAGLIAASPSFPGHRVRPVEHYGFHDRQPAGEQPHAVASASSLRSS